MLTQGAEVKGRTEPPLGGPLSLALTTPGIIEGETAQVSNQLRSLLGGKQTLALEGPGDAKAPTQGLGEGAASGTRAGGGREVPAFPDELLKRTD